MPDRTDMPPRGRTISALGAAPGEAVLALWSLLRSTARLWRLTFLSTGAWFCLGFAVHTLALVVSAQLGAEHGVLAFAVFVVGVVATLVAFVLMIHSLEPHLRATAGVPVEETVIGDLRVPGQVFARERAVDVVATAVGPFLAVYAVWGFVEDQVRDLFLTNYGVQGLGDIENFSISFSPDRLRFYAVAAAFAWVTRQVLALSTRHGRRRPLTLLGIFVEALWVFSLFAVLIIGGRIVRAWLQTRAGWVGLQDGWLRLLDALPDWPLPFGLTVPQALDQAAAALIDTVLPGAWQAVALPLVWLALTATVLGWRQFDGRDVVAGTRLEARASRLPVASTRTRTLLDLLTGDLRTKYLPVLQALRLVGYAGPRFVGVYLVLATVLTAAQQGFDIGVTLVLGPRDAETSLAADPALTLLSGLIFTPLAFTLYAAAFDEALAAALRRGDGDLRVGPRPDTGRRPPTGASAADRRTAQEPDS